MISREDVVSAIGYDGNSALVDHFAKRKYGKLSTEELAKAGFFRAAAASAIWSGSADELALVADYYNRVSGSSYAPDAIPRVFGVAKVTVPRALRL